ncbi:MAG: FxLYD domain-containing protein [Nitrosotalea sp.]
MKAVILSGLLISILFAPNLVLAQENLPSNTSLGVVVLDGTIYSHKAIDGTTIVYGEVQNNLSSPVNDVTLGVTFMDDNSNQVEYKTGPTLLQVIQPGGMVPFSISSTKADPSISQIQVKLASFESSSDRPTVLTISPGTLQVSDALILTGSVTNMGDQKSTNTKLYLISYDAFQRVVGIGTSTPVDVGISQSSEFSIISDTNSKARTYMIVAESDNYQSKLTPVTAVNISLPVVVGKTVVTDTNGTEYATVPVNATANITSNLHYLLNSTQPFVYYVQVKHFGGQASFIGKYQGILVDSESTATVTWTPQVTGSYFIETYVWDYNNKPLSSAVPTVNIVLVR